MPIRRSQSARRGAAVVAALAVLLGAVSVPAAAAVDEHCVFVPIEVRATGELVTAEPVCFPTLADAISYATAGAVSLPANVSGADLLAARTLSAFPAVSVDPRLASSSYRAAGGGGFDQTLGGSHYYAVHFKGLNGTGSSATVPNIHCTGGEWWSVSSGFDNEIESTYNACYRTRHYDYEGLSGSYADTTSMGSTRNLPSWFLNRANSVAYMTG